jgi:hypothetical protein
MPGVVATDFPTNALGGTPAWFSTSSTVKPQTADQAASTIAGLLEHPVPELYGDPGRVEMLLRYYSDVGAFEKAMR